MMKFGVGAFKGARPIEGSLDRMLDQFKQQQAQPQQPKPDPEMMKLQAQQQGDQMRVQADAQAMQMKGQMEAQIEQAKMQADMQIEQMKAQAAMQVETQKQSHEAQMKANELASKEQFERWKAELEAATKVLIAQIGAKTALDQSSLAAEQAASAKVNEELDGVQQADTLRPLVDMHNEAMGAIKGVMEQMARPKRIIRDAEGRVEGVQ
jgi:membrane protein involved in colicin uptake